MGTPWRGEDQLVALAEAARALADATSLDELYPLAADLAVEVFDATSSSLARIEHDRGILRVLRNAGQLAPWEESAPADETYDVADLGLLGRSLAGARASASIVHLDDPDLGDEHRRLLERMGVASSIELPLVVHGSLWGAVEAARRAELPSFGEADLAAGEAFCGLLSAALARIAERDELLDLAYRDALTGLGNRRAVDDHLEQLLTAPDGPTSVAVVLCDVDGLKRVNDTFGHDAGDRLLGQVGALLARAASTVPRCLAARLGGDEFCLVITDITEIDVQRVTERLSDEAAALPMGASLSCGWARTQPTADATTRPGDAARALLRLADAAQYRAKRSGRDVHGAGTSAPSTQLDPGLLGANIAAAVLDRDGVDDEDVEDGLRALAVAVAEAVDAAGWCVSVQVDEGPLAVASNGDVRREVGPPGQGGPGTAGEIQRWRVAREALEGGSFHAALASGDAAEREYVAREGYEEIIGAGQRTDRRHAWLVEVFGDAMTGPLEPHRGLLRALVANVAAGATRPAVSPWAARSELGSTA